MLNKPTTCVCCGRESDDPQHGNVIFTSKGGNYGSTVYDNLDGTQPSFVRAVICDNCFLQKLKDGVLQAYQNPPRSTPEPIEVDFFAMEEEREFMNQKLSDALDDA